MKKEELINLILRRTVKIYNENSVKEKLNSNKKLIVKFGADPSRPDLHLGHTVVLRALKLLQDLGHEIVFVIGDFTAMIGDPSGRSKTRPVLTFEETRKNGESYFKQVTKILDKEKTKIVYNSEWLNKLDFKGVLELCGKYTLARLLEREDFSNRFKDNVSIGIHELLYPLMQGYDSVALEADIEVGGTDQTFNLLVGRELQKDYGQESQDVLVFPLLIGLDGKDKMSKSLDNYIGIYESPEVMFEKAMKIPDDILLDYFKLTTDIDLNKAEKIIENDIFNAHKEYAREIIRMYHGEKFIKEAEERYELIAKGKVPDNIEIYIIEKKSILKKIMLTELLFISGLFNSKSEARRMIEQNGISINGIKESDINKIINEEDFVNDEMIIKKGKNVFLKIIIDKKN